MYAVSPPVPCEAISNAAAVPSSIFKMFCDIWVSPILTFPVDVMRSLSFPLVLNWYWVASNTPGPYAAIFWFPKTIIPLLPNPIPVEDPFAMTE